MEETPVADAAELLAFWTAILRGGQTRAKLDPDELAQVGLANRCKAAEMLGKLLGLPADATVAAAPPVVVDDIPGPRRQRRLPSGRPPEGGTPDGPA